MTGITSQNATYRINGVIDTDKTVRQNMEILCSCSQSWLTYDIHTGQWSVIINQAGNSIASFDDSNIIGPLTVTGTGLTDLYNRCVVSFPHQDLRDQKDTVDMSIPPEDRNPNEPDNTLNIDLDCVNDPIQAQMIGLVELKQSRVDQAVKFVTDYSQLGINAGDLIDITNSYYGFNAKMFRVVSVQEADTDDGGIQIEITALEYDANVYDMSDLFRYLRSDANGLTDIGAIPAPGAPLITSVTVDSRPRVLISATVPAGIVEGMEFWFSEDGVNFTQVSTEYKIGGGTISPGTIISTDYDKVVTGSVYAKVRAMNSTTTSPFSSVTTVASFNPVQTTEAIKQTAPLIQTSSGNALVGITAETISGWAFNKATNWAGSGGVLQQLGYNPTGSDFVTGTGATADKTTDVLNTYISSSTMQTGINNIISYWSLTGGYNGHQGTAFSTTFTLSYGARLLMINQEGPIGTITYQFYDSWNQSVATRSNVLVYFPGFYRLYQNNVLIKQTSSDVQNAFAILNVSPDDTPGNTLAGTWRMDFDPAPTQDLTMHGQEVIYPYAFTSFSGSSFTVMLWQ